MNIIGRFLCWLGYHKEILIMYRSDNRWECRRPSCKWKNYHLGPCVTYGEARTFETEGDMYEYLTGHRSKVIDDGEKK